MVATTDSRQVSECDKWTKNRDEEDMISNVGIMIKDYINTFSKEFFVKIEDMVNHKISVVNTSPLSTHRDSTPHVTLTDSDYSRLPEPNIPQIVKEKPSTPHYGPVLVTPEVSPVLSIHQVVMLLSSSTQLINKSDPTSDKTLSEYPYARPKIGSMQGSISPASSQVARVPNQLITQTTLNDRVHTKGYPHQDPLLDIIKAIATKQMHK